MTVARTILQLERIFDQLDKLFELPKSISAVVVDVHKFINNFNFLSSEVVANAKKKLEVPGLPLT